MSLDYAVEKFTSAVAYAASSPGSVQERLAGAFVDYILFVSQEGIRPELWQRIAKLTEDVTRISARGTEGDVRATTSQMSTEEAARHLKEIVDISYRLESEYRFKN